MTFWLNGTLHTDEQSIHISDRGFLLGDGLFETFRIENGVAQDIEAHFERLNVSLPIMELTIPYNKTSIFGAMEDVIKHNNIQNGSMRLTLSRGTGPRGLLPSEKCEPTVLITATSSPKTTEDISAIKLHISTIRRNETSPASQMKTIGGYLDNILALQLAKKAGVDDAILLNTKGFVACTSSANIFLQINGKIYTPPIEDGILNGITRQQWISDLHESNKAVTIKSITTEDLNNASDIWLTNSLIGKRRAAFRQN